MQKESNEIYLDHVSTSSINEEVLKTYKKLLDDYYNSDALYDRGVIVYRRQEESRERIADLLNVKKEEIIFTSGASEGNNFIIKGLSLLHQGGHIVSSVYEHSSVYEALKQVERYLGINVTFLRPDITGKIDPKAVEKALRDDTFLVTVMAVNNEIGSINDIHGISTVVKKHPGIIFHSDMTQALGKIPIDLKDVDAASFSAHKIHGIKGSGFLFKRRHIAIAPLISAGQQEFHLRGGTSNSPANIVLAKTVRIALENESRYHDDLSKLTAYTKDCLKAIDGVTVNTADEAIAGLINISTTVPTEVLINALNLKGIMVSGKSTCGSRENEPSRTLAAMGIDSDHALRISFDYYNRKEEIDTFIETLKESIHKYGKN